MRMKAILLDLFSSFKKAKPWKKVLLVFLLLMNLFFFTTAVIKVNYEVLTPGSINSIVNTNAEAYDYWVLKIDTDNSPGNVNTVGVYHHKKISYFQYLISKLSDKIDLAPFDPKTDTTKEEDIIRGDLQKDYSIDYALIVAYEAAKEIDPNIHIEYSFQGLRVLAVNRDSRSGLKPGDLITKIDGRSFEKADEFRVILEEFSGDDVIKLEILRNGETLELDSQMMETEDGYKLGIQIHEKMTIDPNKTKPKFERNNKLQSRGPSGGAMMALAIYNALTDKDITKGKVIIGTGEIALDGTVGAIGGVPQKIATAALYGADIFFIGEDNYEEALAAYQEMKALFKPGFRLIKVKEFKDIISELEALP